MRILFLSGWFPYPPINGFTLRAFNLLRALGRQHEVTLASRGNQADADAAAPVLAALCRAVEVVPADPFRRHRWTGRVSYLSRTPRWLLDTLSPDMERSIVRQLAAGRYDLIVASQTIMAAYAGCFGSTPALFEEVELGVLADQRPGATSAWQRCQHALTWAKYRLYLNRLLPRFRACTVVSETEQRLLASAVPHAPASWVIPNGIDLADYDGVYGPPHANQLIFTGSFRYPPNHDAMCWFVREVYPLIRVRVPDVQLTITGDAAQRPLPAAPNVVHTGHVEDVRPLVAGSCVSVAPIRIGGGTRVKILEAMALGTPVVATSKGAEGLDVRHGVHLLIADTPRAFAEQVLQLLADRELRVQLSRNARSLIEARYDWKLIGRQFNELVAALAERRPGRLRPCDV
jgi:glycosyltransferase involved in cell wall biosynthesis